MTSLFAHKALARGAGARNRTLGVLSLALLAGLLLPDLALAQGGDPFTLGVEWARSTWIRGLAMAAVGLIGVMLFLWQFRGAAILCVLGGGLVVANLETIVGWMGI
ncbi:hypothetical protein [Teichococcus rhizosphaerae]|uniref:hypothetical protein n=1 Tax=Teichococcus rhizosphaerae TaxID=1335062 RepID=UPI0011460180|nr:hypothetical protein [Pseudoroseomonas rhizosphaerae]